MKKIWLFSLSLLCVNCVSLNRHNKLEKDYNELKDENEKTKVKLQDLDKLLMDSASEKSQLKGSVDSMTKLLEDYKAKQIATEKQVATFGELVNKFKALSDTGQLRIKVIDGRMVVELATDILFPSGSAFLSKQGIKAIREVGQTLASIPERKYQVEGHTDNVPIKSSIFPSNWELASARAITVVKTMVDAGLSTGRVSAASFGEFRPARPNDSKENKSANRRIEIVVLPDLSLLPGAEELKKMSAS